MSSTAFGVDDSLWDTLSVEMGDEVDQVEVLEEKWTVGSCTLCLVRMGHWDAIAGGICCLLGGSVPVIFVCSESCSSRIAVGVGVTGQSSHVAIVGLDSGIDKAYRSWSV